MKCFVVKRDGCFSLHTESSGRLLLVALLVGDEFRIATTDEFATVRPRGRSSWA